MFSSEIFLHLVSVPTSYAMYLSIFPIMPLVKKNCRQGQIFINKLYNNGNFILHQTSKSTLYLHVWGCIYVLLAIHTKMTVPTMTVSWFFPLQIQWKYYSSLPVPSYHIHVHKVYVSPTGRGGHSEYCWYRCVSQKTAKKGLFSDLRRRRRLWEKGLFFSLTFKKKIYRKRVTFELSYTI